MPTRPAANPITDEERLAKLAKARELANAKRSATAKDKKLKEAKKLLEGEDNVTVEQIEPPVEQITEPPAEPEQDKPVKQKAKPDKEIAQTDNEEDEDEPVKIVKKPSKKKGKKPVVIIEQESDESDFDDNERVIFVKRRTQKPKKPDIPTPPPTPAPAPVAAPAPPVRQQTHQEKLLQSAYDNMFNGNFMNRRF